MKKLIYILLILFISNLICAYDELHPMIDKYEEAANWPEDKFMDKLKVYKKIIKEIPDFAGAYGASSRIYGQKLFDYKKAIECLDKYTEIEGEHAEIFFDRGKYYKMLMNFDQALKDFEKALKLHEEGKSEYKRWAAPYTHMGIIYNDLGDFEKAKEMFEKVLEMFPGAKSEIANQIGIMYIGLQDYKKAIEYLKFCLDQNVDVKYAHSNLGSYYMSLKEYDKSEFHITKALAIDSTMSGPYWGLANIAFEKGKYLLAKEHLEIAKKYGSHGQSVEEFEKKLEEALKGKN